MLQGEKLKITLILTLRSAEDIPKIKMWSRYRDFTKRNGRYLNASISDTDTFILRDPLLYIKIIL